jgi:hypothetical protein
VVQSAALHALAQLGGAGIADRLIEVAKDETRDPGVRMAAEAEIRALGVEHDDRRVGLLPIWLVGMVTIAAALAVASVIGAPALVLLAIGAMLVAGGGIAASRRP